MKRIVHFDISADDPERAIKFYTNVFGWSIQKWDGPMDYWLVTTGPKDEPGIDAVEAVMADSVISAVNWSEVIQKSVASGVDITGMRDDLQALGLVVVPFLVEHAELAWRRGRSDPDVKHDEEK